MRPQRLHLLANERSGKGAGGTLHEIAQRVCDELGAELIRYPLTSPRDLEAQSRLAVAAALKDGDIVAAAGGDGTIRGVAEAAHGKGVRFAVIPCGTFNFFARTHNIPEDHEAAFRLALTGETRPVRLGEVNGRIFLINASLGLYAKAIQEREMRTSRWGRNRLVVILSTFASILAGHRNLEVELATGPDRERLRTPMIFIGNNALQLRNLAMDVARCMKIDMLAVVMMQPISKWETVRVLLRGIFHTLEKDEKLNSFCVDSLTIHTKTRHHTIALDGEMLKTTSPLNVKALHGALNMVLPPKAEATP